MHGKFPNYLNKDHVDVELSLKWMKHTGLKEETEGLITAAQDQALNKRYYSKHIIKQGTTDKPDIVIQEKKSDRCLIIDVAIPCDYNIQKKATEKMSKYVNLQIEFQRIWNKKVEVIPAIIGATGILDKNIKKYN